MTKFCPGCGSALQYTDKLKVGYSPKKDAKLCERCFKLKNYNQKEVVDLKYNNDDIIEILNRKANVVFFITDFLNINKDVVNIFNKIKAKKYLVINKIDYIPYSIKLEKYKEFIKEEYLVTDDIIFTSATKKVNINELNNKVLSYSDSYFCGYTNSGKSTIINAICKINNKKTTILESLMPNTTLDFIKIRLTDENYIFDTPGFIGDSIFDEKSFPKKYLKPITIQVKKNDVIKIGNERYISCDSDNSFTFYMSPDIKVSKDYKNELKMNENFDIDTNSDVLIEGIGFINIKNKCHIMSNFKFKEIRKSMF